jgi:hypothetical protein
MKCVHYGTRTNGNSLNCRFNFVRVAFSILEAVLTAGSSTLTVPLNNADYKAHFVYLRVDFRDNCCMLGQHSSLTEHACWVRQLMWLQGTDGEINTLLDSPWYGTGYGFKDHGIDCPISLNGKCWPIRVEYTGYVIQHRLIFWTMDFWVL